MWIPIAALTSVISVAVATASLNGAGMSPGLEVEQKSSYFLVGDNGAPAALRRAGIESPMFKAADQVNGAHTRAKRVELDASHAALPFVTQPGRGWTLAISDIASNVDSQGGSGGSMNGAAIDGIIAAGAAVLTVAIAAWAAMRYCPGSRARVPRRVDTEQRGIELPAYKPRARSGEVVLEHDPAHTPAYDIARSASHAPMGDGDEHRVVRQGEPVLTCSEGRVDDARLDVY